MEAPSVSRPPSPKGSPHRVVVYANGESLVKCPVRSLLMHSNWPPRPGVDLSLHNVEHHAWALRDIRVDDFEIVHMADGIVIPMSDFLSQPVVHTLHHPQEPQLSALYHRYPAVNYVAISEAQRRGETMPRIRTIRHGIKAADYAFRRNKERYLTFIGRMAPINVDASNTRRKCAEKRATRRDDERRSSAND